MRLIKCQFYITNDESRKQNVKADNISNMGRINWKKATTIKKFQSRISNHCGSKQTTVNITQRN